MNNKTEGSSTTAARETEYFEKLAAMREGIGKLRVEDPLRIAMNFCIENLEKIRSNMSYLNESQLSEDDKKNVFNELVDGLDCINEYMNKPFDQQTLDNLATTEKEPVPTMSRIISGLSDVGSKVKSYWKNRTNLQKGLIVLGVLGVITAAVFAPPILLPAGMLLAHSMGMMAIPALGGVLPGMTVSAVITNVMASAAFSVTNPMAWKYTKGAFEEWRYREAVKSLETKIETLPDNDANTIKGQLKPLSIDFLNEVKKLKTTGDNSVARAQIVKALETWNKMLDKPTIERMNEAQKAAIFGGDLPSPTSRIRSVYNKLGYVAIAAAVALTAMVPLSAAAHVTWASNFLLANIPIPTFGMASNTGVYYTAAGLGIGLGVEHGVMPAMSQVAGNITQPKQEKPLKSSTGTESDNNHPLVKSVKNVVDHFQTQANTAEVDVLHIKHTALENIMLSYKERLQQIEQPQKENKNEQKPEDEEENSLHE